eukprot:scaffold48556_cov24-Tisochrysis_lutea.AAC.1
MSSHAALTDRDAPIMSSHAALTVNDTPIVSSHAALNVSDASHTSHIGKGCGGKVGCKSNSAFHSLMQGSKQGTWAGGMAAKTCWWQGRPPTQPRCLVLATATHTPKILGGRDSYPHT